MKTVKLVTSIILGILAGLWFTIADSSQWWMAIISILAAIGCFIWVSNRVENTVLWVLAMLACFLAVRFVGIPFIVFVVEVWIGLLAAAISVTGWAFKTLGIVGGVIIVILIIMFLKGLVS